MTTPHNIPWRFIAASGVLVALALACSGATLDENSAGSDVWMEGDPGEETGEEAYDNFCQYNGAIATDDRAESAYVMLSWAEVDCWELGYGTPEGKALFRVKPEGEYARPVLDLSDHEDVRVLFPDSGLMVMGERLDREHLYLFDHETMEQLDVNVVDADYNGTRSAPSGDWVAVADNDVSPPPIHLIDSRTLDTRRLLEEGSYVEAMWLNERDTLAVITEPSNRSGVTLSLWDPTIPTSPELAVYAPAHHFQVSIDYTWIGVHPYDELVVFPVQHKDRGDELLVLDTVTEDLVVIENAHGPVGFSPEGDLIVAYRYEDLDGDGVTDEGGRSSLLLIDTETYESQELPVPFPGYPEYFVNHEGRVVVVASMFGDQELVLFDLDTGAMSEVGGPSLGLEEFVSRQGHDELWMVDQRELFRLDLATAELETIDLDWRPEHINILPSADLLVLDEADDTVIRFLDPETRTTERTVELDARSYGLTWTMLPRPVAPTSD
jgi:hypothetical protein